MDVRVVIKKSGVYLAAFWAAGLVLLTLLIGSNLVFHEQQHTPVREIVLALAVAVFFSPLKAYIQRAFDRYLYREPYDYQRTIREASRGLGGTIELSELVAYVQALIARTLKPGQSAIYLLEEDDACFELVTKPETDQSPRTLFPDSILVARIASRREAVFLDEVPEGSRTSEAGMLRSEFERVGAEVVVPLFEEEQVIGLLCIGAKLSGDPYFSDDADLLTTLANQAAVAFRNAQTHQHVVQLNEETQKVLAAIESGVIAVGPRGKISLFNRAAEQLTGVLEQTVRGRPVDHLPAPLARLLAATAADGQSRLQVEILLPSASGQLVSLVCSTSPLRTPPGTTGGVVMVLADLSRLRELEQEKRNAERLASFEAIASGLVHEVRNPLVAIKTFAQLLPIRFHDEEFRDTFSRVTVREIGRIDDLLTRFRTLSSPASEPMQPLDVSLPLQDALEILHPRLEMQQISLRRVGESTPRPILGNASQLEQLFLNLCTNAIEAMGAGGELTVRIADLSGAGGTSLLVEISDTGTGISEDLLATIFDPFVTTKAQGTGLGLAICRSIADAHHARLSVRNNVERAGSTFTIEFPVLVGGPARVTP